MATSLQRPAKASTQPLPRNLVDQLGKIKAAIADLEAEEQKLLEALRSRGPGSYEGKLYRATVVQTIRETLDLAAVRAKLSAQFIARHTRHTEVFAVRVVAR